MGQQEKRSYNSGARSAQAAQTRCRILEGARRLFQSEGFDQVTISQIANAAEVSMPTVYSLFRSKRGVLQALIDDALPPKQRLALVDDSMHEPSPQKRLGITARLSRQMYDAESELVDILRGALMVAPEFKELEEQREQRRYERQEEYVKKLMQEKALAAGLTLQKARDILWALTGRDMYRMLVGERGWTSDEYEQWLAKQLVNSLLN